MSSTFDERIPLSRLHLQGVRGGLQSCRERQFRELTGCRGRGIHPDDLCGDLREWLLREKLRQADAEAPEDQGLSSVSFGAGLLDLEHVVPELEYRYDAVSGIDDPVLPDAVAGVLLAPVVPVPSG